MVSRPLQRVNYCISTAEPLLQYFLYSNVTTLRNTGQYDNFYNLTSISFTPMQPQIMKDSFWRCLESQYTLQTRRAHSHTQHVFTTSDRVLTIICITYKDIVYTQ